MSRDRQHARVGHVLRAGRECDLGRFSSMGNPNDEPASVLLERIRQVQTKAKNKIKRRSSIVQSK